MSTGVFIVWFRNCSHENQPSLILRVKFKMDFRIPLKKFLNPLPRIHFVRNLSSESYDLLIENITRHDEGLYYCGTERQKVEEKDKLTFGSIYSYGNTTRITIVSSASRPNQAHVDCNVCWNLLYSLCTASAVLSSVLSLLLAYHCCPVKGKQTEEEVLDYQHQTRENQDEDVCYAALDVRNPSQRPRKKKAQSSDFSTYSAIRTSRM
ncbi:uncharacterized protein LOC141800980 [Halichoeres trimaculatus]|uniref:uncharacterized protein LOC141800980 n=1 Tax=Halichoeres trimaculatus TaxID=147232 RepID=UPI003D9DE6CA